MPSPPPLPSQFELGKAYALQGSLLNDLARGLNTLGQYGQQVDPATRMDMIEVTSAANTGGSGSNGIEDNLPPYSRLGKYLGKRRWWNHETEEWETDDVEVPIDTGSLHDGRGEQYGPAPALIVGDVIPGYLDRARSMLVALPGLYNQTPDVEINSYRSSKLIAKIKDSGPVGFNCILEVYDPTSQEWFWPNERRIICPEGRGERGEATGSSFVMVPMKHGSRIRLRAWYRPPELSEERDDVDSSSSQSSDEDPKQPELITAGLRIQAAGRIHKSIAAWRASFSNGQSIYPVAKTTVVNALALDADVQSRTRDTPFFKVIGTDRTAVEMECQSNVENWNCLVWFHAYFAKEGEDPHHKIRFKNTHGETMPAFGVARVTGDVAASSRHGILQCTKPDTTFATLYLVNGPDEVGPGQLGWGTFLTDCDLVFYGGGFTPAYGQEWGPTAGQWYIVANRLGFLIQGAPLSADGVVRAVQHDVTIVYGKTKNAISKNGTGTVGIWCGPITAETDTGWSILATQRFVTTLGNGKWVVCWRTHGVWKVAGEC